MKPKNGNKANGNKWILDNLLKVGVILAASVAAWSALSKAVDEMKPQIKTNTQNIVAVEKDIIGVKGSVEALRVQQEGYHAESDKKLDEILTEVRK